MLPHASEWQGHSPLVHEDDVPMTNPGAEDFGALHEHIIQFMGAFSSTQFAIDSVIGLYLRREMPHLGLELDKQFLRRIRDEQRLPLFKAFAIQAKYNGDLAQFTRIYNRAKQLRDLMGHSLHVVGPVYSPNNPPMVGVTRPSTTKTNLVPHPLLPSTFTRFTVDCEWLTQHVHRAAYTAVPQIFVDFQGNSSEPPTPESVPQGGESLS
jgi:hypothetical protein